MIGAMLLGANALDPGYPLVTAATTGVVVHLVLSVLFATVFAVIAPRFSTVAALSLSGIAFGAVLWLVNFYVVAPTAGWTWFPEKRIRWFNSCHTRFSMDVQSDGRWADCEPQVQLPSDHTHEYWRHPLAASGP